jgi:Holliday junction resolvase RusA-like endonuclease
MHLDFCDRNFVLSHALAKHPNSLREKGTKKVPEGNFAVQIGSKSGKCGFANQKIIRKNGGVLMKIKFTVQGEPFGKERPRICRKGPKVFAFTPAKTASYEKVVRAQYKEKIGIKFEGKIPIKVKIIAYYKIPERASEKQIGEMVAGLILPTKKPDVDNICKLILDALSGVCYEDDVQICKLEIKKFYSENPRVELEIEEIEPGKTLYKEEVVPCNPPGAFWPERRLDEVP